jgi:hypothetical protein
MAEMVTTPLTDEHRERGQVLRAARLEPFSESERTDEPAAAS